MKSQAKGWRIVDHYSNPGPVQFDAELEGKNAVNLTIRLGEE